MWVGALRLYIKKICVEIGPERLKCNGGLVFSLNVNVNSCPVIPESQCRSTRMTGKILLRVAMPPIYRFSLVRRAVHNMALLKRSLSDLSPKLSMVSS